MQNWGRKLIIMLKLTIQLRILNLIQIYPFINSSLITKLKHSIFPAIT